MKSHATLSLPVISERWDISAHIRRPCCITMKMWTSGYPDGLEGAQQTMFTRILHVADVYDAPRPGALHKEPYAPYEATEYLMGAAASSLTARWGDTSKVWPLYPKGTMVTLSDGKKPSSMRILAYII